MRINVNPEAQPLGDFGYVKEGEYTLRVVKCEQKMKDGGEYPYLNWSYEFADPNLQCVNNEPGQPKKKAGNIFDVTSLNPSAQGFLRSACDAFGLTWGDFDTDDTIGLEFRAKVGIEEYNGKFKNNIAKYLKK